jgi:curved DNA-binding protein CbpA
MRARRNAVNGSLACPETCRHIYGMRKIETISLGRPRGDAARACSVPGCNYAGEHRAPRSRDNLEEFYWFCLEHVREYNKSWNFCRGMSEEQVEREIRNDTVWRRPTWPLGSNTAAAERRFEAAWRAHGFGFASDGEASSQSHADGPSAGTAEQKALRCMDLIPPVNLTQLKARYKELVKQFHPDANGGDKAAEERLKDINDAYTTLRRFLTA